MITGTILGIVFGASSLYLVLKVGLTVSASIPVAVISITLWRLLSKFHLRDGTILEHNIEQTAQHRHQQHARELQVETQDRRWPACDADAEGNGSSPALPAVCAMLCSRMVPSRRWNFDSSRHSVIEITATGIEALTVRPTFSTRYKEEAPKRCRGWCR